MAPINLLVLETQQATVDWLQSALRRAGFDCVWHQARTEQEFLARLATAPVPDTILIGAESSELDVAHVRRLLRERAMTLPLIGLTDDGIWQDDASLDQQNHTMTAVSAAIDQALHEYDRRLNGPGSSVQKLCNRETVLDTLPVLFWLSDPVGTCHFVNRAWLAYTGCAAEQEVGNGWLNAVHPDDAQMCLERVQSAAEHQDQFQITFRLRRSDGIFRWMLMTGLPEFGEGRQFMGYIGTLADVSEQHEVEEAARRDAKLLTSIYNAIPAGVAVTDEAGRFVRMNDAFCKIYGYKREELVGQLFSIILPEDERASAAAFNARLLHGDKTVPSIRRRVQRNGATVYSEPTHAIITTEDGQRLLISSVMDVTKRTEAEDALRLSEEKFNKAFHTSPDSININRLSDGLYIDINEGFTRMTGFTRADVLGKLSTELGIWVHSEDRERLVQKLSESGAYNLEAEFRRKDGSILIGLMSARIIDINGVLCLLSITRDITERKRAEQALRESEEKFRGFVEQSVDGICLIDEQGILIEWNRGCEQITGQARSEVIGKPIWAVLHQAAPHERQTQESYQRIKSEALGLLLNGRKSLESTAAEVRIQHPDGTLHFIRESVFPIKTDKGFMIGGILHDVTRRQMAEEALRQSEAAEREQRILAEALRDTASALTSTLEPDVVMARVLDNVGLVMRHDEANIMLVEGDTARIVYWRGYSREGSLYLEPVSLETPTLRRMIDTGAPIFIADTALDPDWHDWPENARIRSYAAAPLRVQEVVIGFLNLDSPIPGFFNAAHAQRLQAFADQAAVALENAQLYDELQRRAAELEQRVIERTAELEQQRLQLQTILDAMSEGVIHFEMEQGKIHYVNLAFSELTGYGHEQVIGQPMDVLGAGVSFSRGLDTVANQVQKTLRTGKAWRGNAKFSTQKGLQREVEVTLTPVIGPGRAINSAVGLVRDVGQERALQEQKDRFIANASHELRTPVTNCKLRLYLARKQPERWQEHLVVLEQAIDHMKVLVENLLDLSRFDRGVIVLNQQRILLQELISASAAEHQLGAQSRGIDFTLELPPEPVYGYIDGDRVRQVIDNITYNALSYTPEGGHVWVKLSTATQNDRHYAVLHVKDTGIGIAEEALPRLFEPFYRAAQTTAKGTGLGLAIAKEVVDLHKGFITVESQLGQGSAFSVWLPLTA